MTTNEDDDVSSSSSPTTATAAATVGGSVDSGGLIMSTTDSIRSFLITASSDSSLHQDFRDLSSLLSLHPSVPYKSFKSIWLGVDPNIRPDLATLLTGSNFIFTSPKPREKSVELKVRLKKLAEVAERKAYAELVKDITPRKGVEEPFSTYKDQLGFGLHVVLIMFTGYLLGYAAFRALFSHSPAMSAAGGILGLVGGMLVEAFLFIIRTSNQDLQPRSSTLKIKKNQ